MLDIIKTIINNPLVILWSLLTFFAIFYPIHFFDNKRNYGTFGAVHYFARRACRIARNAKVPSSGSRISPGSVFYHDLCNYLEDKYNRLYGLRERIDFKRSTLLESNDVYYLFECLYYKLIESSLYPSRHSYYRDAFFNCVDYLRSSGTSRRLLDFAVENVKIAENVLASPSRERIDFDLYTGNTPEYFKQFIKQ